MAKYFTMAEMVGSNVAYRNGIDNTPPPDIKVKLNALMNNLLDPVREMWGKPIRVNSGFRCPVLNNAVKGAKNSQHTKGEAADITTGSPADNKRLFDMIIASGIDFDKLIDEKNYSWLHLSYRAGNNRRNVLHL